MATYAALKFEHDILNKKRQILKCFWLLNMPVLLMRFMSLHC